MTVVKDHILPVITPEVLLDQYGFKPHGSTTTAIVNITHAITILLRSSKYFRCLLIDFSKAFDLVHRLALVEKLKTYSITDNIIDWVVSFLTEGISI